MRKYETFFIVDPDLPDEINSVVDDKLRGIVTSSGGLVISYSSWGKKKLAYPVKKRTRGHYILMEYAAGPELVAELERNMRLDERVLKFITVKIEERYDPEKEEARKAAESRAEEGEGVLAEASEAVDEVEEGFEAGDGEEVEAEE